MKSKVTVLYCLRLTFYADSANRQFCTPTISFFRGVDRDLHRTANFKNVFCYNGTKFVLNKKQTLFFLIKKQFKKKFCFKKNNHLKQTILILIKVLFSVCAAIATSVSTLQVHKRKPNGI